MTPAAPPLTLNPSYRVELRDHPDGVIAVIDDVYADPRALREFALAQTFDVKRGKYPGVRAPLPKQSDLAALVSAVTGQALLLGNDRNYLAIITYEESELGEKQITPHVDKPDANIVAGVVYLNPPEQCFGGTAFYRHRASGITGLRSGADVRERMRAVGCDSFEAFEAHIYDERKGASAGWTAGSNEHWELIELVEMRPNRLAVYPAWVFHSAYMQAGAFGREQTARRLTQNIFFDVAAVGTV